VRIAIMTKPRVRSEMPSPGRSTNSVNSRRDSSESSVTDAFARWATTSNGRNGGASIERFATGRTSVYLMVWAWGVDRLVHGTGIDQGVAGMNGHELSSRQ